VAKNGEIALKIAEKMLPDLILLDIMMPGIDGYEVCRRLKTIQATVDIPVIFITAKTEMADEVKGFDIGGVDYISKPISPPVVLARVRAHLSLQREKKLLKENIRLRADVERITRHDLKSPLNGIINYPTLVKSGGNLSEKQQDQLDKIVKLGRKMLNLINLSLDLYKMERRTYVVNEETVDVLEVLTDIMDENRMRLKSRQLRIDMRINSNAVTDGDTFPVRGEKLLIYSMLSNLLKNAIEASPRKEQIVIDMNGGEPSRIGIHNRGSVPEEIRGTFFDKYTTAGKSEGTGLGTYSAKLIVETLGGRIRLDTSDDAGTTVQIALP
jgi:signal transduction histidine kinase